MILILCSVLTETCVYMHINKKMKLKDCMLNKIDQDKKRHRIDALDSIERRRMNLGSNAKAWNISQHLIFSNTRFCPVWR